MNGPSLLGCRRARDRDSGRHAAVAGDVRKGARSHPNAHDPLVFGDTQVEHVVVSCFTHERSGIPVVLEHRHQERRVEHAVGQIVQPADALGQGDRPISRSDILSMDGDFTRGDVLHVYDSNGIERARGLSDFTSEELRVLIHNPDTGAEQLLGYKTRGEIIRSNNLVMLENRRLLWEAPEAVVG